MSRYLVIFISPLVYLISFLSFFYYARYPLVLGIVAGLNILLSWYFAVRESLWRSKWSLLSLWLAQASQLIFLVLLISGPLRYGLTFLLAFIWALVWWLLGRHYRDQYRPAAVDYLSALKFFYYLNFWFLANSAYALIVLVQWPVWQAMIVLVLIANLWFHQVLPSDERVIFSLILLQIGFVLYLIPVSFFVAGTLFTLWIFFLTDKNIINLRYFSRYLMLFIFSVLVLLFTSLT